MINNRQGGRRRGRGGQRGQNLGGNRQDNRQRGNAAQLLEKYKNMARDAQLGGDRVQAEYYLQFADHYFRVLGDNRPRFDEQRRQRDDDGSDEDSDNAGSSAGESESGYQQGEEETADSGLQQADDDRGGGNDSGGRDGDGDYRRPRGNGRERPRRNGGPQREPEAQQDERIAFDVLPPAIGQDGDDGEQAAPKPRRRAKRPPAEDGDTDIAPAA